MIDGKLSFTEPRWSTLDKFHHNGEHLRNQLKEWPGAVEASGSVQFNPEWINTIFQMVLHQGTVVNSTLAVVPY